MVIKNIYPKFVTKIFLILAEFFPAVLYKTKD